MSVKSRVKREAYVLKQFGNELGFWVMLAVVGTIIYKNWKGKATPQFTLVQPLPTGAELTGKTTRTTNSGAPGQTEIVGYAVRDWAEYITPMGQKDWVEIRR
jgi:hypothetical protein